MKTVERAYKEGMEAFAKHCLRYGNIVSRIDHDVTGKMSFTAKGMSA